MTRMLTKDDVQSSEEHLRVLQWQIGAMYTDHQLLDEQYWADGRGARWLIGRPGTGIMLTEIIAGIHGSLVVHGDCDLSRFAYYSDYPDAWHRLCWMGLCRDVGYYVDQKFSIGMSRSGPPDNANYDARVARHDIIELIKDYRRDGDRAQACFAALRKALDYVEDKHELYNFLYTEGNRWDLFEHNFGCVVPTVVITGHLALQRCVYLLLDRHGEEGPPACRSKEAT